MIFELISLLLALAFLHYLYMAKKSRYPPFPYTIPILGNMHLLGNDPFRIFQKMSSSLGPVITVWFGYQPVVVVNDIDIAREMLLGHDDFSGRLRKTSSKMYARNCKGIISGDFGQGWLMRRKLGGQALRMHIDGRRGLRDALYDECRALCQAVSSKIDSGPIDLHDDFYNAVMNVICSTAFGSRYNTDDAEFQKIICANKQLFEALRYLIVLDMVPVLLHLPIPPVKRLRKFVAFRDELIERKLKEHEENFNEDDIRDFTDSLLSARSKDKDDILERDQIIMILGDLFLGGGETTAITLLWAVAYLVTHPTAQDELHKELSSVIKSPDRIPELERSSTPYLQAFVHEVLRCSAPSPTGVPHRAIRDTEVRGYRIPKDTAVIFNYYAMLKDERHWIEPDSFDPRRFLDENGAFRIPNQSFLPFSAGRRICMGKDLAMLELYSFLSYLVFHFEFKNGEIGGIRSLKGNYYAFLYPDRFMVNIKPRKIIC